LGIQLRDAGATPCSHVLAFLDSRLGQLQEQIADLEALRQTAAQLRDEATDGDPSDCHPEQICRYL
jgi:MerR family Zn(II)-responsive transcriptional regulator of zntA